MLDSFSLYKYNIDMEKTKGQKIKDGIALTKLKRKAQVCKVFEIKIDESALNTSQRVSLKMMFVEAKWCWNHILNQPDIFKFDYKQLEKVQSFDKDKNPIEHKIENLSAKNRQDIVYQMRNAVKSLAAIKRKTKKKVGKLKFKSEYDTIELSQYGCTHKISGKNTIKINGIKKHIKVCGLEQITPVMEFANAKLSRRPSGYFFILTTYQTRDLGELCNAPRPNVGLDFGIMKTLTTSDGDSYKVSIPEDKRLRRLQRKLNRRAKKGSKNRHRLCMQIKKCYEHIGNQKKDKANKIIHDLFSKYNRIYFQDENIKGWHASLFGKQVQHSCLGTIKRKLKEKCGRTWMIDRFFPSTKLCYRCGAMNDIALGEEVYRCPCGLVENRDIKAAKTMLLMGMKQENYLFVPMEHREIKPAENLVSTSDGNIGGKLGSMKQEAPCLIGSSS